MRRRPLFYSLILLIVPAILAGWLLRDQIPIWTAPRYDWFSGPDGTVAAAACESADLLRTLNGTSASADQPVTADAARGTALEALERIYGGSPGQMSVPRAFNVTFSGQVQTVWWVTAAALGGNQGAAAMVLVNAQSGDALDVLTVLQPLDVESCTFDARRALIDAVRSTPVLLLVAYVGLIAAVMVGMLVWRTVRRRSA